MNELDKQRNYWTIEPQNQYRNKTMTEYRKAKKPSRHQSRSHIHKIISKKQAGSGRFNNSVTFVRSFGNSEDSDLAQVSLTSAERAEQAKYSGHYIYNNIHGNGNNTAMPPPPASGNPPPLLPPRVGSSSTETQAVDGLEDGGKMSSVRRTFCLYALFDLGLMFILWVIYTQLIGEPGYAAFEAQVEHFSFKTSLFDSVMLSAVRVTFLLLAYGLYRSTRCWMVAFCTALTCGVLVSKIFIFDFDGERSKNNPLSYCLIIISFVLSWSEMWFVDFKMLPTEKKLRSRMANRYGRGYGSVFVGGGGMRPDDLRSIMTEDNTFYSPVDSPDGSDTEETNGTRSASRQQRSSQENDYIRLARHCFEVLWAYLHSPESEWKLEKGTSVEDGLVHSKKVKGVGKVFRLKCYIDLPGRQLYDYMNAKPDEQTDWNATVKECRVLQVVDDSTDLLYVVSNELGGGAIQSRDFVSLRKWGERNGMLLSSGMGVKHPDMPPQKNYIRGHNGVGGYVFAPHPEDPNKTLFYWFMNTDIKGWFPQKLIDANLASVLVDFQRDVTKQAKKLKETPVPQVSEAELT